MRLTEEERRIIREAVAEVYGPTAVVRLFGSRVRDDLRGGDIDLHVEADAPEVIILGRGGLRLRRCDRLWQVLQERLGEQKIDIVETLPGRPMQAIEEIALSRGLRL